MNLLDYTILAVMGISALVGLLRGFVRETVSLLMWIAAFWLALTYSTALAQFFSGFIHDPSLQVAAAFVALFILVLLAGVIVNFLLASLLKKTGLGFSDRVLGVVFGLARGGLVVALVVLLVELTPLVESTSWQGSAIIGFLQPLLGDVHKLLPSGMHATVAQGFSVISR